MRTLFPGNHRGRSHARPMTEGSILRHLLVYAIPAILGDLFQVTYNTVDSIIVGKYAGAGALASVGVASPLMSVAMFFIIGVGIGASVLMSEFYGAGDQSSLRREFSTTLVMSLGISTAIGMTLFFLASPLLKLVNTPEAILKDTVRYLRIVAAGMIATGMYNILAAASRSVGDTRTPLKCMVAGSLINVGLDLWFVGALGWGVSGAAVATVISQACSAGLCGLLLRRNEPVFFTADHVGRRFGVDRKLLSRTVQFSYASALQQAGIYVGKLLVQSMVNPLGVHAAAAFTAVNRIDDYALIPQRDIGNGEMVLVAQNHGARRPDRMLKGLKVALLLEISYSVLISLGVFMLAGPLMRLFVSAEETEVLELGARYLQLMGLFYILPGIANALQGYMRAVGRMKLTMAVTYSQMFTRALFTFLLIGRLGLDAVPLACVAGWILMTVWEGGLIIRWKKSGRLIEM